MAHEIICGLILTLTQSHTQDESLGSSPRDSHYSTKPHTATQQLKVVYCRIETTAGCWYVFLCFCFLVVSACTVSSDAAFGTRIEVFSKSHMQSTSC